MFLINLFVANELR